MRVQCLQVADLDRLFGPRQRHRQRAPPPFGDAARFTEFPVDEIDPRHIPLLFANDLDLLAEFVGQPGDRVGHEAVYAVLRSAGARQLAVIIGSRPVVMVARQVAGRLRQTRFQQDRQFDQTRRAAVAVAERVYPGDIQVSEDGLENGERLAAFVRHRETVQSPA